MGVLDWLGGARDWARQKEADAVDWLTERETPGQRSVHNMLRRKQREREAYETQLPENQPEIEKQYRYERAARGLSDLAFGLGDLTNTVLNAGIRDIDYITGGGLSSGTYNPYQLGMPSQIAADAAARWTGEKIVPDEAVPEHVRNQGTVARTLFGMSPAGGVEDAMFIGLGGLGKLGMMDDATRALKQLDEGADAADVWRQSKMAYDPLAGYAYSELSDANMDLTQAAVDALQRGERVTGKLGDVIESADTLPHFKAYPDLKDVPVNLGIGRYGGEFRSDPGTPGAITATGENLERGEKSLQNVLGHEIQHKIARTEGWPGGSNLQAGTLTTPDVEVLMDQHKLLTAEYAKAKRLALSKPSPETRGAFQDIGAQLSDLENNITFQKAYEYYRRNPGEVQARNTGSRISMRDAEQRANLPWDTMDLPYSEQLKVYDPKSSPYNQTASGLLGEIGTEPRGGLLGEVSQSVDAPTAPTAPTAPKGRKQAITAVSLRDMDPAEALDIARREQHIIPNERGFVGAPDAVKTPEDLAKMRESFDAQVESGLTGAGWYDRAQSWIKRVAGPDPKAQSELAHNLGLFSSQADPKSNLGFSVAARNSEIMEMPRDVIHTGQQARNYREAFKAGKNPKLGKKTGVFAHSMDPTMTDPSTGTNDIWHARTFGYTNPKTGKPWDAALTPQQHSFMDGETVLAVGRANDRKMGGRSDWTAGEIQAAPWVAAKGKDLTRRWNNSKAVKAGKKPPMSDADGMALARMTYPDYEEAFLGFGQHEMTPGKTTGHLPGVAKGDEAMRAKYAKDPRSWWKDKQQRDKLYAAQGAYTAPTEDMTGIFEGGVNPGQSARPLVAYSGKSGERVLDPASKQLMSGTEAFRAWADAQDAGASLAMIPGQKAGHMNAYQIELPPDMQDAAGLLGVMRSAREGPLPGSDVVHFGGPKGLLSDWRDAGIPTKEKKAVGGLMGELGVEAKPVRREGGLAPPYDPKRGAGGYDWSKPGSDTATKQMLAELNPAQRRAFEKPEVRKSVLDRMIRDDAFAKFEGGGMTRKDIQYARKLFYEKGFKGLEDAMGKGLLPAAALGVFLPYALGSREKEKT